MYKITKRCIVKFFKNEKGVGEQHIPRLTLKCLKRKGRLPTDVKSDESQPREPSHRQGTKQGYIFPGPSHLTQMQDTRESKRASLQTLGTKKVHQPSKRATLVTMKMNLIKKR